MVPALDALPPRRPGSVPLRLYHGDDDAASRPIEPSPSPVWLINGYAYTVLIWSPESWSRLEDAPPDAQACPQGFHAALREVL